MSCSPIWVPVWETVVILSTRKGYLGDLCTQSSTKNYIRAATHMGTDLGKRPLVLATHVCSGERTDVLASHTCTGWEEEVQVPVDEQMAMTLLTRMMAILRSLATTTSFCLL